MTCSRWSATCARISRRRGRGFSLEKTLEFSLDTLPTEVVWLYAAEVTKGNMMTESDVAQIVEREIERAGGVRALSREWGVSPCMISDLRNGRRGPGPKVLKKLGMKKVLRVEFVKAGR